MAQLMALDAGCWQEMAEQGLFQKAEDLLTSAAVLEEKTSGQTERYAMLMHSLGALYDFRSNVDVTGQQQSLSMASAKFAERAVLVCNYMHVYYITANAKLTPCLSIYMHSHVLTI